MKRALFLTSLSILALAGAPSYASSNAAASLAGDYDCKDLGTAGVKAMKIAGDKLTVIRQDGVEQEILSDKSNLLSPIKKDMGVNLFVGTDTKDHQPVSNFEIVKTKSGKILVTESDDVRGYSAPADDSDSDDTRADINPDVICTPK